MLNESVSVEDEAFIIILNFIVDAISIDSTMFQKEQKEAGYISESCEIAKAFELVKGRSIKDRDCDFDETFDFTGEREKMKNEEFQKAALENDIQIIDEKDRIHIEETKFF